MKSCKFAKCHRPLSSADCKTEFLQSSPSGARTTELKWPRVNLTEVSDAYGPHCLASLKAVNLQITRHSGRVARRLITIWTSFHEDDSWCALVASHCYILCSQDKYFCWVLTNNSVGQPWCYSKIAQARMRTKALQLNNRNKSLRPEIFALPRFNPCRDSRFKCNNTEDFCVVESGMRYVLDGLSADLLATSSLWANTLSHIITSIMDADRLADHEGTNCLLEGGPLDFMYSFQVYLCFLTLLQSQHAWVHCTHMTVDSSAILLAGCFWSMPCFLSLEDPIGRARSTDSACDLLLDELLSVGSVSWACTWRSHAVYIWAGKIWHLRRGLQGYARRTGCQHSRGLCSSQSDVHRLYCFPCMLLLSHPKVPCYGQVDQHYENCTLTDWLPKRPSPHWCD